LDDYQQLTDMVLIHSEIFGNQ